MDLLHWVVPRLPQQDDLGRRLRPPLLFITYLDGYASTCKALTHLHSQECVPTLAGCTGHTTFSASFFWPLASRLLHALLPLLLPWLCTGQPWCHPGHGHPPRTTTSPPGISAYNRHFHLSGTYACCTDGSTSQLTTLLHRHSSVHFESRRI